LPRPAERTAGLCPTGCRGCYPLAAVRVDFQQVRTEGLVKVFGATRALAGVDLTLDAGTVTCVEGPNGSGKSTLLGILAQLVRPSRGHVRYGSLDATDRHRAAALRHRIGVLAHQPMIYPDLSGRENLHLFARLYDIPQPRERIGAMLERFEIGAFVDRPARTWSRGQLQRVALARTLLPSPRLLLLDEPSTGLDEAATARLVHTLQEERAHGAIQLLVTHDAALAERVSDRRLRIERGRWVGATQ
jgi:ABC-type multidrug transport system ATPase subunit